MRPYETRIPDLKKKDKANGTSQIVLTILRIKTQTPRDEHTSGIQNPETIGLKSLTKNIKDLLYNSTIYNQF